MLNYKIYKNNNKKNAGFGKFYARAMHNGTTNLDDIAAIIERNCSMKKSDVKAVLTELVEVMTAQIQDSKRVKLDGLGTFKIGISTKGAESAAAFNPAHQEHAGNLHARGSCGARLTQAHQGIAQWCQRNGNETVHD